MGWRDGWTFYPANSREKPIHEEADLQQPDGHNIKLLWADFTAAIEAGKQPKCDAESGHLSTSLSLLGMLSYKLGRSIEWHGANETVSNDEEANKLLRREYRKPWEYPAV
jgi:hypothetical protein